ncbi:hypothetical protein JCM10213_005767 [Rhodosporidiobolus nylandii]
MRLTSTGALGAIGLLWAGVVGVQGAPIPQAGDLLTEETWKRTQKGVWLVEHYSPYCSHCKAFAPKWKELVDLYSPAATVRDFHFAQVDCATNGDLCHAHSVKYYPSIFLYKDGEFVEEYNDKRTVELLGKYAEAHYPVSPASTGAEEETSAKESGEGGDKTGAKEEAKAKQGGVAETAGRGKKGAEKARLPKEEGEATGHALPVLHVAEEGRSTTSIASPAGNGKDEDPLEELVKDAEEKGENEALFPSKPTASATSAEQTAQTPSASPTSTAPVEKFVPPPFVAQQPAGAPQKRQKPDGTVKALKAEDVAGLKANEAEPAFVKYYAPWCGHCKKLAPKWADLASTLSTSLHVYEMDCDAQENKKVCRQEGVRAYPTLMFYSKGASVEYLGKRDVESMKQFAVKAMSSTTITPLGSEDELKSAVSSDEVVVLFLHSPSAAEDELTLAQSAAKSLLGASVAFYSSSSPELHAAFASDLPLSAAGFLTFKDHSLSPYSSFALPGPAVGSPPYRLALTRQYLRTAKLPTVSELNGATFSDLMPIQGEQIGPAPPPLLGLVILSRKGLGGEGFEAAKSQFEQVARGWTERRRMGEKKGDDRDVLWAWVDGDKWAGWARSMFDVKMGAKDGPRVVIADPKDLTYYASSLSGAPLEPSSLAVYELVEQGIYTGKAKALSSRNMVERFAHATVHFLSSIYHAAVAHPILTFLVVAASWYALWKALKRAFAPDLSSRPHNGVYQPVPRGPKRE